MHFVRLPGCIGGRLGLFAPANGPHLCSRRGGGAWAYHISSLSTPLNALFAAGGVTARGSLRSLKHFRGKQLVQQVDAYDLLLHGIRSDLKRLENGDTLLVPSMGPEATIEGMVRRPAVYELLDEKSLADVLELAGGILPTAALRHIEVQRAKPMKSAPC